MAGRHLSRAIALQSLFEWDFSESDSIKPSHHKKLEEIVGRNVAEFGEGNVETEYVLALVKGAAKKKDALDAIIAKAARDWPLAQTPLVDRNVLRLGLYELLFAKKNEVPERVAINEAIELAKEYGGERSGKFVNGVLGTIYKEMGEPGRDELPRRKRKYKRKEDLTPAERAELPLKKLVGAMVYSCDSKGNIKLAFVHDVFGHWTLSKGGVEEDEDEKVSVLREIKEELNLEIVIDETLGVNEYVATDPERGNIRKRVTYFIARTDNPDVIKLPEGSGGLDKVAWFAISQVAELNLYPDVRPIVDKAIKWILNKE